MIVGLPIALWDETWRMGAPEWKAVALAHAIILGIAVGRYVLLPRLRRPAE